ncbi:MAG: class I SAM-dependent rRNA methyltransferase [Acidobacteria bacterium]|nr:class I SAM-dependent rRNA methyltransferase [Acidobacteriota bacterium]
MIVTEKGAARFRAGHPWVYRSDLKPPSAAAPGSAVTVEDARGRLLGTAFYSSASQIALRLLSTSAVEPGEPLAALLHERIVAAITYRRQTVRNSDAFRLVFSEADALPGLIADQYHDLVSLQISTQGMDRPEVRETVIGALQQEVRPAAIIERVDSRVRELEQLPEAETRLVSGTRTTTVYTMNGLRFHHDGLGGQKTGAFLDQRENYAAAAQYAHGQALDVFCYQGGFALHLARAGAQVTAVDISRPALEAAEQNAALNVEALGGREIEWIDANAFDLLRDYADAGRQYETIVLDPPPFARSKRTLEAALRGYKELNLRALKMLRPGGILITCSCSYHVSESAFLEMLAEAASDAHRQVRILEKRGQAQDHPVVLSIPETDYLKCVIANVSY